jgi:ribonuclease D
MPDETSMPATPVVDVDVDSKHEHFLGTPQAVAEFFGRLSEDPDHLHWCAVDAEADSMHAYETKLCLLQFASGRELALIDPLAMPAEDLSPMLDYLDKVDGVWFHGADYDMTLFLQTFQRLPGNILDTQTAARLTGATKFGLANLIEETFGFKMSKASQKADWGQRPLPEKMIRYAYDDVRYMLELADIMVERLHALDRYDWFAESCRADMDNALTRDEQPNDDERWRIQGWGKLSERGLGFLRALWQWRDDEARRRDRPAFKVLNNHVLLDMSRDLEDGRKINLPHYIRSGAARRLIDAAKAARSVPDDQLPTKPPKKGGERLRIVESKFDELRTTRDASAKRLNIDPTLIAPRWVLERLAAKNVDAEEKEKMLLSWQRPLIFG